MRITITLDRDVDVCLLPSTIVTLQTIMHDDHVHYAWLASENHDVKVFASRTKAGWSMRLRRKPQDQGEIK